MKKNALIFTLLFIIFALRSIAFAVITNEEDEFIFAKKAFEDKFYEVAKGQLESFVKKYPRSDRIVQAQLMLGQCNYHLDKLLPAISELEKVLNRPRQINVTDVAFYWLGEIYLKGKDFSAARDYFGRVVNEFPDSEYRNYALHSIAMTYFESGAFRDAFLWWEKLNKQELDEELAQDIEMHRGIGYLRLNDYDAARRCFSLYIKRVPRPRALDEAYYYLGEANFNSSDYHQALENYSQVITRFPRSRFRELSRFGIAWTYLKMERLEDAQEYFAKFIELNPRSQVLDSALLGLAASLAKADKYEEALDIYERLIKEFPASQYAVSAYLGKADCLYNLFRFQETVDFCLGAIKKFSRRSDRDDFFYTLGWAYQKMGRSEDAILTFEDLLRYSDDEIIKASSLAHLGDIYLEKNEFKRAQDAYDSILKEHTHSLYADYAQMQLGMVFFRMDKYDAAIIALRSLLANFPKTRFLEEAGYYIAMSYFKQGNFPSAEEEFAKLVVSRSRYAAEANVKRGVCLMNMQRHQEALDLFKRIRMSGMSREHLMAVDYYSAWAQYFSGKEKNFLKSLNDFLLRYPDSEISPDIIFWLGEYYYRNKNWSKARDYFLQIPSRFPRDDLVDDAYYWLGWVLYHKKDHLSAIRYFEQLTIRYSGSPLVPDALYRKGIILKEARLFKEAADIFQQLERRFPDMHFYYLALKEQAELKKEERDFKAALSLLRKAENCPLIDLNALIKFDMASILEEDDNLNDALVEYLKIVYLEGLQNKPLIERTNMKIAGILEKQGKWYDAQEVYSRLISSEQEDIRRFARERLNWLKANTE